jgi:hypothetical protein
MPLKVRFWSLQESSVSSDRLSSGGDKRPRTFTGKCFRALDPPQKFLLIDKILSLSEKVPSCDKKEGSR